MKKTILAASVLLLAPIAQSADVSISGHPHQAGSVYSWTYYSADNLGYSRERYNLGNGLAGNFHVHIEFDGSQWPNNAYYSQAIKPLWSSAVSLTNTANSAFMTPVALYEQVSETCWPIGDGEFSCNPNYQVYGQGFVSNTLNGVQQSKLFTKDLLSIDFDMTLQAGVNYYLFVNTFGTNDWQGALPYTIQISSVPVPAAGWLMGSALLGLAGLRRRVA